MSMRLKKTERPEFQSARANIGYTIKLGRRALTQIIKQVMKASTGLRSFGPGWAWDERTRGTPLYYCCISKITTTKIRFK